MEILKLNILDFGNEINGAMLPADGSPGEHELNEPAIKRNLHTSDGTGHASDIFERARGIYSRAREVRDDRSVSIFKGEVSHYV